MSTGFSSLSLKASDVIKVMNGLKQAHLMLQGGLCNDLKYMCLIELPSALCLFQKDGLSVEDIYIQVYLDNVLIFGTPNEGIKYLCGL